MQRIADETKLSPGNLTYHFPKKENLMLAIYHTFQKEIFSVIPPGARNKPDLRDLDTQIKSFYKLQQRFLFFYLDLLEIERTYEIIAQRHYNHIKNQIRTINIGLEYNVQMGFLKKDKTQMVYKFLAEQLWSTAVFWPRQVRVRGIKDNIENLRLTMWHQILPHLTKEGILKVNTILSDANNLVPDPYEQVD